MALSCLSSRMCTQGSKLQCILNPLSASFWPNTRMRKRRGNPSFKIKWELQVFPFFWGWNAVELSKWRWPCLIGKAIFKTLLLFLRDEAQCCSERKILHLFFVKVVNQSQCDNFKISPPRFSFAKFDHFSVKLKY